MSKLDVSTNQIDASTLSQELIDELQQLKDRDLESKEKLLKAAKIAILEIDCDEHLLSAVDFLQCQVEHQRNQDKLVSAIRDQRHFREDFGDLRYMVRELQDNIMEALRYGKRTQRIDDMLLKLSSLVALANQNPGVSSTINLANAEAALSPRCSGCVAECRSAHRKVQTFVTKLWRSAPKKQNDKPKK